MLLRNLRASLDKFMTVQVDSALALLDDFHRHVAQLLIDSAAAAQRPPIVKVDLHRAPHRDPARDRQTLLQYAGPSARLAVQQHPADDETRG